MYVWGLRPQIKGITLLLFAIIAFYFIGRHWDGFILQLLQWHSCLTCCVVLTLLLMRQPVPPSSSAGAPPLHSLRQLNFPSQGTQPDLMLSCVCLWHLGSTVFSPGFAYSLDHEGCKPEPLLPSCLRRDADMRMSALKRHLWLLLAPSWGCYAVRLNQWTRHSSVPQLMAG